MNKKISLGSTLALMLITAALTVSITMVLSMRRYNDCLLYTSCVSLTMRSSLKLR